VLVVFVAMKFAWDTRVDSIRAETDQKTSERAPPQRSARDRKRDEEHARASEGGQFYD
jgi:hypothetical protein